MSVSAAVTKGIVNHAASGMISGNVSACRTGKPEKKVKKQLNYNYKEISGQLLRASRSQSAAAVLVRAKSRLSVIQRSAATGQYDRREVECAMAHARGMVRCAQLKVRNLKVEEQEQKQQERERRTSHSQKKKSAAFRAAQKENQLLEAVKRDSRKQNRLEKMKIRKKEERQRIHRDQERAKINETDARYLRERGGRDYLDAGADLSGMGVLLDLSIAAAVRNEEQVSWMEQQEAEAMDSVNTGQMNAGEMAGMGLSAGSMGMTDSISANSIGAAVGTINISI